MKRILAISVIISSALIFSGCSLGNVNLGGGSAKQKTGFLKSTDGATTWVNKEKIDDKKNIASADIISMAINPKDPNNIYIGTLANGIFVTKDGAEIWTPVAFPDKVYGLALDPQNPQIIYASGINNGRGKIYKRENEESQWKEIYTEPADGTFISSMAIDKNNPRVIYAGTNAGVIIKSEDGGGRWNNLPINNGLQGAIISIAIDAGNSSHVLFGVFQKGIYETKNAGGSIENITERLKDQGKSRNSGVVYSLIADPYFGGTFYAGLDRGLFKTTNGSSDWKEVNIIESSKKFPIRAIAINPKNSSEVIYSAAKAIYKSVDGGNRWSTFELDTVKSIGVIKYDPNNSSNVYAGFRELD